MFDNECKKRKMQIETRKKLNHNRYTGKGGGGDRGSEFPVSCTLYSWYPAPSLSGSCLCVLFLLRNIAQCCKIHFQLLPTPVPSQSPLGIPSPALSSLPPTAEYFLPPLLPGSYPPPPLSTVQDGSMGFFFRTTYEDLKREEKEEFCEFVAVPKHLMGFVIGKEGNTIKEIQTQSGARIIKCEREHVGFMVRGNEEEGTRAVKLINDKVVSAA